VVVVVMMMTRRGGGGRGVGVVLIVGIDVTPGLSSGMTTLTLG